MVATIGSMRAQREVFERGRDLLVAKGVPYAVGGGLGVQCYGHFRKTKDIDFFIPAECAEIGIEALAEGGFRVRRSDPRWLYQSWMDGATVDLVFRINTSRGQIAVDREMIDRGSDRRILGGRFWVMSPEDLIIVKVLVMHEDRPDWWDAISILRNRELDLNWNDILRYASLDPVKVLGFLLFTISRHGGDRLIPEWVLGSMWQATAERLSPLLRATP